MVTILDLIVDYCYLRGFEYSRLDGGMSYADREKNVSIFSSLGDTEHFEAVVWIKNWQSSGASVDGRVFL